MINEPKNFCQQTAIKGHSVIWLVCSIGYQREIADLALNEKLKQIQRFGSGHFGMIVRLKSLTTPCSGTVRTSNKITPNLMKYLLVLILFLTSTFNSFSQDTLRYYLNDQLISTNPDSATLIREIITHKDHYSMSYLNLNGAEINYCEFKSLDPFILDGLARHYYESGTIYSTGSYNNDKLTGRWLYHGFDGEIDTVTYQSIDKYSNILGSNNDKRKIKKPSIKTEHKIQKSIIEFLRQNFHLPARTRSAHRYVAFGVKLIIDLDGKLKGVNIPDSYDEDLQLEVYRILSMYQCDFEIKKAFETTVYFDNMESSPSDEPVFFIVDTMPEFPGGDEGVRRFIAQTVRYPVEAQKKGIQGRVYVSFVIDRHGKIGEVKIAKGIDFYIDNEALRVVRSMPDWTPGSHNGKPVKVTYTVPIIFVLQ
ncbi:energy transducer TonB [Carboxylicivirga marina]|nr:energy transducer TonB [Carboxylicivirga marina]